MDSTQQQILKQVTIWGQGSIFFPQDFPMIDSADCTRKALCQLTEDGTIIRLARGIYCYPRITGEYGMTVRYPSEEAIAEAVARKESVRIIPYGDEAAYRLGLTTMRVSSLKYLTDGSPRVINLAKGRKIYFNHTSEVKMFAFINVTMQMVSSSIRFLGAEYLDDELKRRRMREILRGVPEKDFMHDITLPPAWVGEIMTGLWNG